MSARVAAAQTVGLVFLAPVALAVWVVTDAALAIHRVLGGSR